MSELVLVTGGAGFIGSHTVELLLKKGFRVRILDNFSTGKVSNLPLTENLEILTGDIRNDLDVMGAARNADYVIHLAAQVSVPKSINNPKDSFANNLTGLVNVLDAVRTSETIKKIVFASSAAIYGDNDNLPLSEEHGANNNLLSPYALEKFTGEEYIRLFHKLYEMKFTILRYFNVFGPRQDPASPYSGVISKFLNFFQNKEDFVIFGDGKQTRDFIHVSDIAAANVSALHNGDNDVFNVATGKQTTLLDLVKVFEDFLQKEITINFKEAREGDIKDSLANANKAKKSLAFESSQTIDAIKELIL